MSDKKAMTIIEYREYLKTGRLPERFNAVQKSEKLHGITQTNILSKSQPVNNTHKHEKVEFQGIMFDSKAELKRYWFLKALESKGEISDLKYHGIEYLLIPQNDKFREIKYEPDFTYYDKNGSFIVEDVKGFTTCKNKAGKVSINPAYKLFKFKQKLMYHLHKIEVKEVKL